MTLEAKPETPAPKPDADRKSPTDEQDVHRATLQEELRLRHAKAKAASAAKTRLW